MQLPEDSLAVLHLVRHAVAHFPDATSFIQHCRYGIIDFAAIDGAWPTLGYALGTALFVHSDPSPEASFARFALLQPKSMTMPLIEGHPSNETIQCAAVLLQRKIYVLMLDSDRYHIVFKTNESFWGQPPIYLYRDPSNTARIYYMHMFNNTKSHLFCKLCTKTFTMFHFHTHKCVYPKCRHCTRIIAHPHMSPFLGGSSHCGRDANFAMKCLECSQMAHNEICFQLHALWPKRSCKIFVQCAKCMSVVRRNNKHICGHIFCRQCYAMHEGGTNSCYIKRNRQYKQLVKRGKHMFVYCMQIIETPNLYMLSRIDRAGCSTFVCQNANGFTPVVASTLDNPLAPTNLNLEPGPILPLASLLSKFFGTRHVQILVQEEAFYRIIDLLKFAKLTVSECTIKFQNIVFIQSSVFVNFDIQTHGMQMQRIPCIVPRDLWPMRYCNDVSKYIDQCFDRPYSPLVTTWLTALKHAATQSIRMESYLLSILIYNFHTYKAVLLEMNKVFLQLANKLERHKHMHVNDAAIDTFFGATDVPKRASIFAYASTADAGFSVFKSCLSDRQKEQILLPPVKAR